MDNFNETTNFTDAGEKTSFFSDKKKAIILFSIIGTILLSILVIIGINVFGNKPSSSGNAITSISGNLSISTTIKPDTIPNSETNSTAIPTSTVTGTTTPIPTGTLSADTTIVPTSSNTPNTNTTASTDTTSNKNSNNSSTSTANNSNNSSTINNSNNSNNTSSSLNSNNSSTVSNKNTKKITFKFYSSCASNVYLAGTFNNWSKTATKMKKNGNWFTVDVDLSSNTYYKFVADGKWYIDGLNKKVYLTDAENSYMDISKQTTNVDSSIKIYSSEHFDFFTTFGKDQTAELEDIYDRLMKELDFLDPKTCVKKIRYYSVDYQSNSDASMFSYPMPFMYYDTSEVFDLWDCNSSHEIIHTFVAINNCFFNEGLAKCYQKEGNITMKEENSTFYIKYLMETEGSSGFYDLLSESIYTPPEIYEIPSSFMYYNLEVLNEKTKFTNFLKCLSYYDSVSTIKTKYKNTMGKDMDKVVSDWENWALTINSGSDIYTSW